MKEELVGVEFAAAIITALSNQVPACVCDFQVDLEGRKVMERTSIEGSCERCVLLS